MQKKSNKKVLYNTIFAFYFEFNKLKNVIII